MTTVGSDFNLSKLQSLYSQIDGFSGGEINKLLSYGDIAWFSEALGIGADIEQIATSKDPNQQANALKSIINDILNIAKKFGNREKSTAVKETQDTAQKAQELNQKSRELGVKMEGKFEEVQASIEEQSQIVTDASELLTEAQAQIKEEEEKIAAIIKKIQEAQQKLTEEQDTKKQAEILAEIQGYAEEITTSTTAITNQQDTALDLKGAVDDATANVADATENMTVIVKDGVAEIGQTVKEEGKLVGEVAETGVKGGENAATAAALETASTITSSNMFTAAATPQIKQAALDQEGAATTRLGSIGTNSAKITAGIGTLENNASIMSQYTSTVGSALTKFTGLVGSWNMQLPATITSIGTAIALEGENTELKSKIPTDLEKLNVEPEEVLARDGEAEDKADGKSESNSGEAQTPVVGEIIELETPKFKFTQSFGI